MPGILVKLTNIGLGDGPKTFVVMFEGVIIVAARSLDHTLDPLSEGWPCQPIGCWIPGMSEGYQTVKVAISHKTYNQHFQYEKCLPPSSGPASQGLLLALEGHTLVQVADNIVCEQFIETFVVGGMAVGVETSTQHTVGGSRAHGKLSGPEGPIPQTLKGGGHCQISRAEHRHRRLPAGARSESLSRQRL